MVRVRMKLAALLGAVALTAVTSSAAVAAAPANPPAGVDSVSGTATGAIGTISVDARSPAGDGDDVFGHFTADATLTPFSLGGQRLGKRDLPGLGSLPALHFEGPVTCLTVRGNRAGLVYPIRDADPGYFEGQAVLITIQDNGPDEADTVGFYGPAPIDRFDRCPPSLPTFLTALHGDLTVTDGSSR